MKRANKVKGRFSKKVEKKVKDNNSESESELEESRSKTPQSSENGEIEKDSPQKGNKRGRKSKGEVAVNGNEKKKPKNSKKARISKSKPEEEVEEEVEQPVEASKDEEEYEVQTILDSKKIRGIVHYLIRWKGYESDSDTWEPVHTLDCPELITEFKNRQAKNKLKALKKKDDETWDENEDFEVDRIIEVHFKKNGQKEFLVSWKGFPATDNSWEPEENMDCKDLIAKFMSKVEKAKQIDSRELRAARPHTDRFTVDMHSKDRRLSRRGQGKQRVHYHEV